MRAPVVAAACAIAVTAVWLHRAGAGPTAVRTAVGESPATPEARGRLVYARYGCAMCHGAEGRGGFSNPNAETDGKVPAVIYVAEGYTPAELEKLLLDGTPTIGKADPNGPQPPYRMPGWRGRMTQAEVRDLVRYLMSLYPKDAAQSWR